MCRGVRLGPSGCSVAVAASVRVSPCIFVLLMSKRICWADPPPAAPLTSVAPPDEIAPQSRGSAGALGRFWDMAAAPALLPSPPCVAGLVLPSFCKHPSPCLISANIPAPGRLSHHAAPPAAPGLLRSPGEVQGAAGLMPWRGLRVPPLQGAGTRSLRGRRGCPGGWRGFVGVCLQLCKSQS